MDTVNEACLGHWHSHRDRDIGIGIGIGIGMVNGEWLS